MSLERFGCMPSIAHRMDRARGTVNDATAWAEWSCMPRPPIDIRAWAMIHCRPCGLNREAG
jgi:hypothetical protein